MKPAQLTYCRPNSVGEAVTELVEGGWNAKLIAGGQSLMPMMNLRLVSADRLIDIRKIDALRIRNDEGAQVRIGACITHDEIQRGEIPDPSNGLMPYIASRIAYQAVRNRGTFGGSLSLADPAADWLTTTAALGATIEWEGVGGKSSCLAEDFVLAPYTTRLEPSDLLTSVIIPRLPGSAKWGAYKLCRKTGEYAHAMAMVIRDGARSRVFLGATDGAPIRLPAVETALKDMTLWSAPAAKTIAAACRADIAASGRDLSDVRIWQLCTCLERAIKMTFGLQEPMFGETSWK